MTVTPCSRSRDTALEGDRLADHHGADIELAHQSAAVPAGRQRSDHDGVLVAALTAGLAEGIGFAMHGRIVFLHAAVVTTAEQAPVVVIQRRADRDAAFGQALAGFGNGGVEQGAVVGVVIMQAPGWQRRRDAACRCGECRLPDTAWTRA